MSVLTSILPQFLIAENPALTVSICMDEKSQKASVYDVMSGHWFFL